ncbi:MAG: hypothetical protein ACK56I_28055, partial [bacterium]
CRPVVLGDSGERNLCEAKRRRDILTPAALTTCTCITHILCTLSPLEVVHSTNSGPSWPPHRITEGR